MKSWEIIADNLSKAGWSLGCVPPIDSNGRTIWVADAHRDDGKRFVVRADEKLTVFHQRITAAANCLDKLARFSADSASLNRFESGGGLSPARFFACSRPAVPKITITGKERKNHEPMDSAKKSSSSISRRGGLLPAFCRQCKRPIADAYTDSYANTDSYRHRFCYWRSRCGGG